MKLSVLNISILLFISLFAIISCDTEDPFRFDPPDFTTVPPAYDYSETDPVEVEEGVQAYILDEGDGFASVGSRDDVSAFVTLRTVDEGEILFSTLASDNQIPSTIDISAIILRTQLVQNPFSIEIAYTSGLKAGLIGMKEGERRTVIVSPEKGFAEVNESSTNYEHLNATLQYDIILTRIVD